MFHWFKWARSALFGTKGTKYTRITGGSDRCEIQDIKLRWHGDTVCAFDLRDDARYVAWPARAKLNLTSSPPPRCLTTLIPVPEGETVLGKDWLVRYIEDKLKPDDVFDDAFLQGIVFFSTDQREPRLDPEAEGLLKCRGNKWCCFGTISAKGKVPRPGPYVFVDNQLWEALRLYEDVNETLMVSVKPKIGLDGLDQYEYEEFVFPSSSHNLSVAVPSRICFDRDTPGRPLDGIRVFVKDNYNIRGIGTSVCNRAYQDLYPPCSQTAVSLQTLINKGAQIMGKTKLSSFAGREEPTECIDFPAPFNPRADGYQSPAGSSSGSGAAVAAYEWIDVALGTDTTGSGRRPGHWNGCFALRPTHGLVNRDGIVPNFEMFDTPSMFTRDLGMLKDVAKAWYAEKIPRPFSFPTTVIYPRDYLPAENGGQNQIINSFRKTLEAAAGVECIELSLAGLWAENPPKGVDDLNINSYLETAGTLPFFFDDYHNFARFRSDYWKKYQKMPYVTPYIRWKWRTAQSVTQEQRDAAVERLQVYKRWLLENVLNAKTVVILPIQELFPNYRDLEPPKPVSPTGFSSLYMSPIVGAPEIVIPFGHIPYESRITKRREYLPCAVSLVGAPNTDIMLVDLARECLERAEKPTSVDTGRLMFRESWMEEPDLVEKGYLDDWVVCDRDSG